MYDRYLVTGGAGFIGTNVAAHYLERHKQVTVLDNLSRVGSDANLAWLTDRYGPRLKFLRADVREQTPELSAAVANADVVCHLAGQVAVTTSVARPIEDFEINARGTLNVLEAVRQARRPPIVLYSSTNKVYGQLEDLRISNATGRFALVDAPDGVSEERPLDFHSPYGCSKGVADQYVIDYARIYGLKTIVFRQSCIYGAHQFGVEDQGWIAWFGIQALRRLPVTVYGTGQQVRDVLNVDDLISAYDAALSAIDRTNGRAYNIGGGPANTLSLLELIDLLERQLGHRLVCRFEDWRPGDQRVFVSDIRRATADFGWTPRVSPTSGIARMMGWLKDSVESVSVA